MVVDAGVHVCVGVGGDASQPAGKRVVVDLAHPFLPGIEKNGLGMPGSEHPVHDGEGPLGQGCFQMGIVMTRAVGL